MTHPDSPVTLGVETPPCTDGDNPGDKPPPVRGFRGPEACAAARITYRQLDYWCRTGLVVPSVRSAAGSGTQRLYSRTDVVRLALVRVLLDAGYCLTAIRGALPVIVETAREDPAADDGDPAAEEYGQGFLLAPHVATVVDVAAIAEEIPPAPEHPAQPVGLTLVP